MEYVVLSVVVLLMGAFLYWAYLPDYKRNPQEFKRTLIGMPIGMLFSILGLGGLDDRIKKWVHEGTPNKKKK